MSNPRLLLVDDDGEVTLSLTRALRAAGFRGEIAAAGTESRATEIAAQHDFHVAVVDLVLEQSQGVESGFRLLAKLVNEHPRLRIIVLTGSASLAHGIRALDMGAAHFIEKPADAGHLLALINDSFRQSELRRAYDSEQQRSGDPIHRLVAGSSSAVRRLREELQFAASNAQALLLTGETGTGKGLCARAVHEASSRSACRFVRYQPNFSGADLVNSDLFGHERGAFTGAESQRSGLIAEARGGTLFLDEVDELPLEAQVALLGVLQDKKFRALGSNKEQDATMRLICATNQDPERCVKEGKLRKDFFHRIAHLQIQLPPLRDRREDIPQLVDHALARLRVAEQLAVFECSPEALSVLHKHDWPGNVRELEAVVEGAAFRAHYKRRSEIAAEDVKIRGSADGLANSTRVPDRSFNSQVQDYKISLIQEALARHGGNQVKAAEELVLDRSTLRRILARS